MRHFLNQLLPFLLLCIAVVAFVFGIVLLAYLFLFAAAVGVIIFIYAWIRNRLFPRKKPVKPVQKSGRIIDSDDWRELK